MITIYGKLHCNHQEDDWPSSRCKTTCDVPVEIIGAIESGGRVKITYKPVDYPEDWEDHCWAGFFCPEHKEKLKTDPRYK